MSFAGDLTRFQTVTAERTGRAFVRVAQLTQESIVEGSALTGAPGQPVDTGALRASWTLDFESPTVAVISTPLEYAPVIEDGVGKYGPLTLRSAVGGFHSRKLTINGFPKILEAVAAEVAG